MSAEERTKIIQTLIVEDDLKEILLSRNQTNPVEKNINQHLAAPNLKQ